MLTTEPTTIDTARDLAAARSIYAANFRRFVGGRGTVAQMDAAAAVLNAALYAVGE